MKYLYIFGFLFTYVICTAQDVELLDKEWFLNEMVINGESYLRTQNVDGSAFFYEEEVYTSHPMCQGGFGATTTYYGNDVFEIFEGIILVDFGCNPDAMAFMGKHHSFYGIDDVPPYNNPFDYIIEPNGNDQMLTVTNVNGDQAIYGTQPILTVEGLIKVLLLSFQILPKMNYC